MTKNSRPVTQLNYVTKENQNKIFNCAY